MRTTLTIGLGLALVLLHPVSTRSAPPGRDVPLSDVLQIVVLQRQLLAIDAESGGQREEDLERGERVVWHASRGRVGVVLTDRRMLAVATRSGAWQEARYRAGETLLRDPTLGDRVALIMTTKRAIGFDGGSGNLVEQSIGPRESVLTGVVGENVAVVITDRRAMGLSPFVGGFFEAKLRLGERINDVAPTANLVTIATSHRLLLFRSTSGSWEERNLDLR
jgi:hypothetical protein